LRWAENVMLATEPCKFCDIGTGDFRVRFSAESGISFSSAFSFTNENEQMHFPSASSPIAVESKSIRT